MLTKPATALTLPWPPSVNAYKMPIRCGSFIKMALTKRARLYYDEVSDAIRKKFGAVPLVPYRAPVRVELEFRAPDRRTRDIQNHDKSLLDALTHCGVWTDDSLIDELVMRRGQLIAGGCVNVLIAALGAE